MQKCRCLHAFLHRHRGLRPSSSVPLDCVEGRLEMQVKVLCEWLECIQTLAATPVECAGCNSHPPSPHASARNWKYRKIRDDRAPQPLPFSRGRGRYSGNFQGSLSTPLQRPLLSSRKIRTLKQSGHLPPHNLFHGKEVEWKPGIPMPLMPQQSIPIPRQCSPVSTLATCVHSVRADSSFPIHLSGNCRRRKSGKR